MAISAVLTVALLLKVYLVKHVKIGLTTELADISIKKLNLVCYNLPVARTMLHGAYGIIPFLGTHKGVILEKASYLIPVFSFFGVQKNVLVLFIDDKNIIYDTRIYDGSLLSKVMFSLKIPDLVVELDMESLGLKNPTIIGETLKMRYKN
jgi:hypothetical protein